MHSFKKSPGSSAAWPVRTLFQALHMLSGEAPRFSECQLPVRLIEIDFLSLEGHFDIGQKLELVR